MPSTHNPNQIRAFANDNIMDSDHASPSQTLHDLLSLGEIEPALSSYNKYKKCKASRSASVSGDEDSPHAQGQAGDTTISDNIPTSSTSTKNEVDGADNTGLSIRLPLLLRWLSVAQPLTTTSTASTSDKNKSGDDSPESSSKSALALALTPTLAFPDPNTIVPLLEDVAAAHPDAENVEVLVSSLAPSICKDAIGKLAPLSRNKRKKEGLLFQQEHGQINTMIGASRYADAGSGSGGCVASTTTTTTWNTKNLDVALKRLSKNPTPTGATSSNSRKRPKEQDGSGSGSGGGGGKKQKVNNTASDPLLKKMKMVIDFLEQDDDDDDNNEADEDEDEVQSQKKDEVVALSSFFAKASSAANDTHESMMRRVLQDLISLVKSSLRTTNTTNQHDSSSGGGGGGVVENGVDEGTDSSPAESNPFFQATGFLTPRLALKSDSLFMETDDVSSSFGGGWSRLSVMIPILMHHAPILRYEHLANALCRAAVPTAPALIKVMAANCGSAATQSLLRGCVTAYQLAVQYECLMLHNAATSNGEESGVRTPDSSEVKDIIRTAVESAKCLASLSRREALNAIRILKEEGVMDGFVLSLLIEHDPICAGSFIVEKLSSSSLAPCASGGKVTPTFSSRSQHETPGVVKRIVPLRQRMMRRKSLGTAQALVEKATPQTKVAKSRLHNELARDKSFAEDARRFISQRIIMLLKTKAGSRDNSISLGEATLFIQAYALLVDFIGIGAGSSAGSGSKFVEDTMIAIGKLSEGLSPNQDILTLSPKDNIYKTAICAALITCSKYPPIGDSEGTVIGGQAVKACLTCLEALLLHRSIFSSRFAGFVIGNDAVNLRRLSLENILSPDSSFESDMERTSQMKNVCRWLSSNLLEGGKRKSIHEMGLTLSAVSHNPIVALEAVQRSTSPKANELDGLMKSILSDPNICAKLIQHPRVCALIRESVKMLLRRPAPHIPLVLPVSLDRLSQSLSWDEVSANDGVDKHPTLSKLIKPGEKTSTPQTKPNLPQLVIQIVYALDFLDHEPLSPFVIDPRSFPLRESLAFVNSCHKNTSHWINNGLRTFLQDMVSKHCPEILRAIVSDSHLEQEDDLIVNRRHIVKPEMVVEAIHNCLNGGSSVDPSGLRAENIFRLCRSAYPNLEVDVAAVGAILAPDKFRPKFYSYVALAKDPLVLLKARGAVWKCRGIRSILLLVLRDLMNANESLAMQSSVTESVAVEYLVARDTIIVRCIVFACASGLIFERHSSHCVMSVNMIRSIISQQRGIIAALIKQDLPDSCIDWLVEFIPEALSDAPIISSLLSERGLLTATERLSAASAGLRIAVAHCLRGNSVAIELVSASIAVLLDSFTLVIGPIGVPVSILREDNGQGATIICREKMFQMIKTLSAISPKNTDLKNEASIGLTKIAALCKSENAVGGVKRKALLKEIWEACVQANTALGGAMQL